MKCREIIKILETLAPRSCACDWDNPGLLAGRADKEVKSILLTLDADDDTVKRAVTEGMDLILSHHPLIFHPIKQVSDENFIGRRLLTMIQNDISYYAMHTNFDSAPGCMADLAAQKLELVNTKPLEPLGEISGIAYGIGKVGDLKTPLTGQELAEKIKKSFGLPFVTVYGMELYRDQRITRVATCPGAGGGDLKEALASGAQAYLTGDISHHEGIEAAAQGMMVIDGTHYGTEYMFMDFMEQYLKEKLPAFVQIRKMPVHFPAKIM